MISVRYLSAEHEIEADIHGLVVAAQTVKKTNNDKESKYIFWQLVLGLAWVLAYMGKKPFALAQSFAKLVGHTCCYLFTCPYHKHRK